MEKLLLSLAKQLDALDEASLMDLWSKYATLTSRFEPTRRWEEACLIFSMIQAKHWKNQLFNYNWSQQRQPPLKDEQAGSPFPPSFGEDFESFPSEEELEEQMEPEESGGCEILSFKPLPEALRKKIEKDEEW